jgi:hypothetical protein
LRLIGFLARGNWMLTGTRKDGGKE